MTACEVLTQQSGQVLTRAQARDLAALARALMALKDPGAAELLEFAKASELAAKGRPQAREKKPPAPRRPDPPAFDDRPLHVIDPSYPGVLRPVIRRTGKLGEGESIEPATAKAPVFSRHAWKAEDDRSRPPLPSHLPHEGVRGHSRGYWCGHLLGEPREEELAKHDEVACKAQVSWAEGDYGVMRQCGYDAADISAELEAEAMQRQEEFGAVFVGPTPRGRRINGSRRNKLNLTPGQRGRARTCDRLTAKGYKIRPDRSKLKRKPRRSPLPAGGVSAKVAALLAKWKKPSA